MLFQGQPSGLVQQLSPTGAVLRSWNASTSPGLNDYYPIGIHAAASGSVYVSGCYPASVFLYYAAAGFGVGTYLLNIAGVEGCDIRQFSANGSLLQTFVPIPPASHFSNLFDFTSLTVDSTGAVYALDDFGRLAYKWSGSGVQLVQTDTLFYALAIAPSTDILYALSNSDAFAVVTLNRSTLQAASSFEISAENFAHEQAVALSPDGSVLYAVGYNGNKLIALNATTGASLGYLGAGTFVDSEWVTTDKAGNLYVSDAELEAVIKLSSNGTYLQTFSSPDQPLVWPHGVAVNPVTNEVVVADPDSAAILIFSPAGPLVRVIDTSQYVNPVVSTYFASKPYGVLVSSTGLVVYSDEGWREVVILTPGNATTLLNKQIDFYTAFGSDCMRAQCRAATRLPVLAYLTDPPSIV